VNCGNVRIEFLRINIAILENWSQNVFEHKSTEETEKEFLRLAKELIFFWEKPTEGRAGSRPMRHLQIFMGGTICYNE
jgi:hypothetical protein